MEIESTFVKKYFVYILSCQDNSYYVGFSENLSRRIQEHKSGYACISTTTKKMENLFYYESYISKKEALNREKQIKGWSRQKKEALIKGDLSILKLLSISHHSSRFSK